MKRLPTVTAAGTTGLSDGAIWISDTPFSGAPARPAAQGSVLACSSKLSEGTGKLIEARGQPETIFYRCSGLAQGFTSDISGSPARLETPDGVYYCSHV